jgi:hypothetical protein
MWALVEDSNVTEVFQYPKSIQIGDIKYPKNIFALWTNAQLKKIGIYPVVIDDSNYKNPQYYINTDLTYTPASTKVNATYGTPTAKPLNDSGSGENLVKGLKTVHKETVDKEAYALLQPSDWMVVRNAESSKAIPSDWLDFRVDVRSTASDMKDKIDAVSDVDALAALYVYNSKTGTRPLGEFPTPPSS